MKQVVSTVDGVRVLEVPLPLLQPGHVLVEVEYSFISSGTELMTLAGMGSRRTSLFVQLTQGSALAKKLAKYLRDHGIRKTVSTVLEQLETKASADHEMIPLGYSCSGRVVTVGPGVTLFQPGDRVGCAGASKAAHSELVLVPENLVVKIPRPGNMKGAASVAVGAIAMQGVRRAQVQLGEYVAIIGLGLVGLISVQLLKLAGARVIGFDLNPTRVEQAKHLGIDEAYDYTDPRAVQYAVDRFTKHMGVDVCLITAASQSSDIVQMAMQVTRKRGRIVAVGIVGMDIQKHPFVYKEIDFLASYSYGPGRNDDRYENKGMDYPYAYVRWTEKRNMEEYLRLLAEGKLNITSISEEFPLDSAPDAYERLKDSINRPVAIFLRYPQNRPLEKKCITRVDVSPKGTTSRVRFGVAGAGQFVRRVHLSSLKHMSDNAQVWAILTRTGAKSVEIAKKSGAHYATTSYQDLLSDPEIDAILIGTRHKLHAEMTLRALEAGKHVFVEKPLALTEEELSEIELFYLEAQEKSQPILLTGFNRRFSPLIVRMKHLLRNCNTPFIMNYQMNAGYLAPDHWLRAEEGGGRNLGEACHIYDLFTYLTDSEIVEINVAHARLDDHTHARNENFTTTLTFSDGSIGTLTYTSVGSKLYPKELFHIHADETIYVLTDYKRLEIFGATTETIQCDQVQKGHYEELQAFVDAVQHGGPWPIPLWHQLQATRIAIEVERQITGGV